jgi:protein-L-isoaspartate(D-aspartate) O-methyltransferase
MNVEQARFNMIEQQIRPWDVLDPTVLELLSIVKREDFVPVAHRALAFSDIEIPLPTADGSVQVMLAPRLEARLLQTLAPAHHEKVLEIGSGSGFMATLLAHRSQQVVSIEIRPELVSLARENLRRAGIVNAEIRQGNGALPEVQQGPWDGIVLSGSVSEVPQSLLQQLKVGGRLVAVVGSEPVMRATRWTRVNERDFRCEVVFDVNAPRLDGFGEPSRFHF